MLVDTKPVNSTGCDRRPSGLAENDGGLAVPVGEDPLNGNNVGVCFAHNARQRVMDVYQTSREAQPLRVADTLLMDAPHAGAPHRNHTNSG